MRVLVSVMDTGMKICYFKNNDKSRNEMEIDINKKIPKLEIVQDLI